MVQARARGVWMSPLYFFLPHPSSLPAPMQNPRLIVLFRFVQDIFQAVDIITSAAGSTKAEGSQAGAAGAAVGVPGMAATAGGVAAGGAGESDGPGSLGGASSAKPLEIVVHLRNLHILLPVSSSSRTCLGAQVDHLMLAIPGGLQQLLFFCCLCSSLAEVQCQLPASSWCYLPTAGLLAGMPPFPSLSAQWPFPPSLPLLLRPSLLLLL